MTRRQSASWQARRWKIFEGALTADKAFQDELSKIKLTVKNGEIVENTKTEKLGRLLAEYGIPIDCWQACMWFVINPNLPQEKYRELIMPPFLFWNAMQDKVGPYAGGVPVSSLIRERLAQAYDSGDISFDIDAINYLELARALFGDHTVVEIAPNVGKEEVKDLARDFWDELGPLIKNPALEHSHGTKLLSHVQPPKFKKTVKRDARIMELHEQGKNPKEIVSTLTEDEAQYSVPNEAYLRVIISRNKHKKL